MSRRGCISVAMIVKNEQDNLPGALESVGVLGDLLAEVCVYDTGSNDSTVELATSFGARVEHGFWDDDFARARNAALAMVKSEWALVIDADERLHAESNALFRALETAAEKQLESLFVMVDDVRPTGIANSAPSIRLLRSSLVEYQNRIHENVYRVGTRNSPRSARLGAEILRISHHGYGVPAKDEARRTRNLRLGELEVEHLVASGATPERLAQALLDRGRSRAFAGDHEGAANDWRSAWGQRAATQFRLDAGARLVDWYLEQERPDEAEPILGELRSALGDTDQVLWFQANLLHQRGREREAYDVLRLLERPVSVLGEDRLVLQVLRLRCLTAAAAGELADATAASLSLVVRHDQIEDFGRLLVLLWGDRPLEALARLLEPLTQAQRQRLARVVMDAPGGQLLTDSLTESPRRFVGAVAHAAKNVSRNFS